MKKIVFILVGIAISCLFTSKIVNAQDIHFSQFYASPMSLNPSQTGFFDGNWRFTNNYRTQWSAIGIPYKTISAGFDKPFKLTKDSDIGLGVFFVNDKSGSSMLTVNKLFLSANYMRKIDQIHQIGVGLQVGYIVKSFSLDGLTVPSQYNETSGVFDPELPNNITTWDENINYPDINFGVSYKGDFGKLKPFGGLAIFHINSPEESFLRTEDNLPMRVVIHGGVEYPLKDNIILKPHLLTMYHKRAGDWIIGSQAYYLLDEGNLIEKAFGGFEMRTALNTFDALIFTGGVSVYGFDVGLSYDINVSKLSQATNNRGAFEISIVYKDLSRTLTQVALPCDRY